MKVRPVPCSPVAHDALKADRAAWSALPPKADWHIGPHVLQLRDCPDCGSTLAVPIGPIIAEPRSA